MELLESIWQGAQKTTALEWAAVFFGLLYVIFISFKKQMAWPMAIISSFLYVFICYVNRLYLETGLQVFYLAMAFYGWYCWTEDSKDEVEPIITWPWKHHLFNLIISSILMIILGVIFDKFTAQVNPYVDAFTTVFSLAATYLVTKKILENWIYWIIIDGASVYLFASRELYLTSFLFGIYTLISFFGLFKWWRMYKNQLN